MAATMRQRRYEGVFACVLAAVDDFRRRRCACHCIWPSPMTKRSAVSACAAWWIFCRPRRRNRRCASSASQRRCSRCSVIKANWPCAAASRASLPFGLCPTGVNAIRYAARLINHLDRLGVRLARQQDSRFSPPFSTLQVGTIQGGAALNIVPQSCRFDLRSATCRGCVPKRSPRRWRPTPIASCCRRCAG